MSIKKSERVVFLLGAGASAEFNLPVMNDFMNVARDNYFYLRSQDENNQMTGFYKDMFTFHLECERAASRLIRNWDNIEELYTQADLLRLAQPADDDKAANLCRAIAWVIWDVYRKPNLESNHYLPLALQSIRAAGLCSTVITTNYDICFERYTERTQCQWRYPGELDNNGIWQRDTNTSLRHDVQTTQVIKLHGSVNWFTAKNTTIAKSNTFFLTKQMEGWLCKAPDIQYRALLDEICKGRAATFEDIQPAIVPPMLGKASVLPIIAEQWHRAIQAITDAKYIFVIGYSFPETDAFMKRMISQGLSDNHDIRKVYIVDNGPRDIWQQKLTALFAPTFLQTRVRFINFGAGNFFNQLGRTPFTLQHIDDMAR
jgi:NAD-dependent SIR2 family protein deacetylase